MDQTLLVRGNIRNGREDLLELRHCRLRVDLYALEKLHLQLY